jgi:tRNA dimethylallyltransferase
MPELIVIGGPTASGKTKAAIQLAKFLNCPILSCDSRQFFREMSIGTAKPTKEELSQARHFFIDHKSIEEAYSSGEFEKDALLLLEELFQAHKHVILVGGSGLYIDAVCKGMDKLPKSQKLRDQLNAELAAYGLGYLQNQLKRLDPDYYQQCDIQNPIRIIRALEIIRLSGKTIAENWSQKFEIRPFSVRYVVLNLPREELYRRINQRVELMLEQGLLQEAKSLERYKHKNALQTVGYQELFDYFEGKITLQRAIELIKQNSRRYAKRQITWFKRYENALWVHPNKFEDQEFLSSFQNT